MIRFTLTSRWKIRFLARRPGDLYGVAVSRFPPKSDRNGRGRQDRFQGSLPLAGTRGGRNILPLFLFVLAVTAVLGLVLVFAWYVGSKARHGGARTLPFESGIVPVGDAEDMRLSIEFYLIAVFFVIFDLETIFVIAWAVAFHDLGWRGYTGASIFIVLLLAALFYEWRTGALDWGLKRRLRGPGRYAQADAAAEGA